MLSRRVLLQAGAACAVLSSPGQLLARGSKGDAALSGGMAEAGVSAALIVHAPEALAACRVGVAPRCLYEAGLLPLALGTEAGLAPCGDIPLAVRGRCADRPLGFVAWGDAAARLEIAALGDALAAVVLIDRTASPALAAHPVQCHLAARRSLQERRALERTLAAFERTGTPIACHWYDAEAGFAAPGRQAGGAADLVWRRTADFLARRLAQPEAAELRATGEAAFA